MKRKMNASSVQHDISTDAGILAVRDEFIESHRQEIYEWVFTLCLKHHQKLHGIFGKAPPLSSSEKQCRWIEKQRAKFLGIELPEESSTPLKKTGSFSAFY